MALYPIVHKETGEKRILEMSVHEIMDWYKENPEWKRDWSEGCASPADVGEWKNKLINKNPGWKEVLDKVKAHPKSIAKDLY